MRLTILVTGANGQIGRALIHSLGKSGHDIFGLDRLPGDNNKFIQCDLLNDDLDNLANGKWDVVVHLAGDISDPQLSREAINSVLPTNVLATIRLLHAIRNCATQVIFASSISVYGNEGVPVPYREMQPLHPFSLYGASKAAAEKYLSYHDLFAKTCVLRIAQVVGPGTPDHIAPVRMVQAAKKGENIPLFCTDATVRDYTHVEDVVKAITSAIQLQASGVFNVGSGKPTKLTHLANHITQLAGVRLEQAHPNPKVPECAMWMSIERARKYLFFEPTWTIERFVEKEIRDT